MSELILGYDESGEEMTLNMGPQHPSTHGVIRFIIKTDGEIMHEAIPDVGYLHRSIEGIAEKRFFFGPVHRLPDDEVPGGVAAGREAVSGIRDAEPAAVAFLRYGESAVRVARRRGVGRTHEQPPAILSVAIEMPRPRARTWIK